MSKFKYHFLIAANILIFMGALMKLEQVGNANATMIAGILNFVVFLVFCTMDRSRKLG